MDATTTPTAPGWFESLTKKLDFNDLIVNHSAKAFKLFAAASTFAEIQNLASTAIMVRGLDAFTAWLRYGIIGLIEVTVTVLFIEIFVSSMKNASKDHIVSFFEMIRMVIINMPVFLFGLFVTSFIHRLYLEATGNLESQYEATNWLNETFPFFGSRLETNCDYFIYAGPNPCATRQRIESAAVFLVYTTPIINVLLVIFYSLAQIKTNRENRSKFEEEQTSDDSDEDESESDQEEEESSSDAGGEDFDIEDLAHFKEAVNTLNDQIKTYNRKYSNGHHLGFSLSGEPINVDKFVDFTLKRCGIDLTNKTFAKFNETDPDVKSFIDTIDQRVPTGTNPETLLSRILKTVLIGHADEHGFSDGIDGIKMLFNAINTVENELEQVKEELQRAEEPGSAFSEQVTTLKNAISSLERKKESYIQNINDAITKVVNAYKDYGYTQ